MKYKGLEKIGYIAYSGNSFEASGAEIEGAKRRLVEDEARGSPGHMKGLPGYLSDLGFYSECGGKLPSSLT